MILKRRSGWDEDTEKEERGLGEYTENEEWVGVRYGKGGVGGMKIRKRRSGLGGYTKNEEWAAGRYGN